MELAYPMSMANCTTCHAGKLDAALADENFTAETCKSCHVEDGVNAAPALGEEGDPGYVPAGDYYQSHRPPPMGWIWADRGVDNLHTSYDIDCQQCHVQGGVAGNATFADLHTGYDAQVYDENGEKYADTYKVRIDNANLDGDVLTVRFSANDDRIVPELLVSLYGWDSKDFYIPSHTYDGSENCPGRRSNGCRMEYVPESACPEDEECANALFEEAGSSEIGNWRVRLDLASWVPTVTDDIPTLIADGIVRKAEITITPALTLDDGTEVALNAATQTIDLTSDAAFVDDYFKGDNAIADVAKCNNCHDQLAVTFHSGSGRGGDLTACRNCHNVTYDGSHLEMASRLTTNYVHSIHSMQEFYSDDVDFTDPVEYARYYLHIGEFFPVFTAQSCEACHEGGTYNVPDQSKSMPAVQSASYEWNVDRNIGSLPAAVTGPASTACGACHRAAYINEDAAGELGAFNAHTGTFGTYVNAETEDDEGESDVNDEIVYGIIDKIMTLFD
jgi:OmcA/MtrC family decaheme c-type cytochrome